jgi:hypothetical protein
MSRCSVCYGKGYYLLTNGEEWEWSRCDCFLENKEGERE